MPPRALPPYPLCPHAYPTHPLFLLHVFPMPPTCPPDASVRFAPIRGSGKKPLPPNALRFSVSTAGILLFRDDEDAAVIRKTPRTRLY